MKNPAKAKNAGKVREPALRYDVKVPKTFRLSESLIADAQAVLGTSTATATIEAALDMIVFRDELVRGNRAMFGTHIVPFDDE